MLLKRNVWKRIELMKISRWETCFSRHEQCYLLIHFSSSPNLRDFQGAYIVCYIGRGLSSYHWWNHSSLLTMDWLVGGLFGHLASWARADDLVNSSTHAFFSIIVKLEILSFLLIFMTFNPYDECTIFIALSSSFNACIRWQTPSVEGLN